MKDKKNDRHAGKLMACHVPDKLKKDMQDAADTSGRSVASEMRMALVHWLEWLKKGKK